MQREEFIDALCDHVQSAFANPVLEYCSERDSAGVCAGVCFHFVSRKIIKNICVSIILCVFLD